MGKFKDFISAIREYPKLKREVDDLTEKNEKLLALAREYQQHCYSEYLELHDYEKPPEHWEGFHMLDGIAEPSPLQTKDAILDALEFFSTPSGQAQSADYYSMVMSDDQESSKPNDVRDMGTPEYVRNGVRNDFEKVLCENGFDALQAAEILKGWDHRLLAEALAQYAKPELTPTQMHYIRETLERDQGAESGVPEYGFRASLSPQDIPEPSAANACDDYEMEL